MMTEIAKLLTDYGGWGLSALLAVGIGGLWRANKNLTDELVSTIKIYDQRIENIRVALAALSANIDSLSRTLDRVYDSIAGVSHDK